MDEPLASRPMSDAERAQALARFHLLQPYWEGEIALAAVARAQGMPLRTLQRWVAHYRAHGLAGLVRKRRADRGQPRIEPDLRRLIEGLALQKTKPSAAAIHRQVAEIAGRQGWAVPSYDCVYDIVRQLDPALVLLAQEGSKAYQNAYDLVYRREAERPNAIWQADHTLLNLWLVDDEGQPARPWLTGHRGRLQPVRRWLFSGFSDTQYPQHRPDLASGHLA